MVNWIYQSQDPYQNQKIQGGNNSILRNIALCPCWGQCIPSHKVLPEALPRKSTDKPKKNFYYRLSRFPRITKNVFGILFISGVYHNFEYLFSTWQHTRAKLIFRQKEHTVFSSFYSSFVLATLTSQCLLQLRKHYVWEEGPFFLFLVTEGDSIFSCSGKQSYILLFLIPATFHALSEWNPWQRTWKNESDLSILREFPFTREFSFAMLRWQKIKIIFLNDAAIAKQLCGQVGNSPWY